MSRLFSKRQQIVRRLNGCRHNKRAIRRIHIIQIEGTLQKGAKVVLSKPLANRGIIFNISPNNARYVLRRRIHIKIFRKIFNVSVARNIRNCMKYYSEETRFAQLDVRQSIQNTKAEVKDAKASLCRISFDFICFSLAFLAQVGIAFAATSL